MKPTLVTAKHSILSDSKWSLKLGSHEHNSNQVHMSTSVENCNFEMNEIGKRYWEEDHNFS